MNKYLVDGEITVCARCDYDVVKKVYAMANSWKQIDYVGDNGKKDMWIYHAIFTNGKSIVTVERI